MRNGIDWLAFALLAGVAYAGHEGLQFTSFWLYGAILALSVPAALVAVRFLSEPAPPEAAALSTKDRNSEDH